MTDSIYGYYHNDWDCCNHDDGGEDDVELLLLLWFPSPNLAIIKILKVFVLIFAFMFFP